MKEICPVTKRIIAVAVGLILLVSIVGIKRYINYKEISSKLTLSLIKDVYIEYGDEVNSLDLVEKVSFGEISEYPEEVDSSSVGLMKLTYEIKEEKISKEVSLLVEVKDTKKPIIKLNSELISIKVGEKYDLKKNIISVFDEVDGDLIYSESLKEGNYTIKSNINNKLPGSYLVSVSAMDKNSNLEVRDFRVNVVNNSSVAFKNKTVTLTEGSSYNLNNNISRVADSLNNNLSTVNKGNGYYRVNSTFNPNKVGTYKVNVDVLDKYNNRKTFSYSIKVIEKVVVRQALYSSVDSNEVISKAKQFIGYKYVPLGNSPSKGFDCSGYVQYVFSTLNVRVGRTTRDQARAGIGVKASDKKPGDILIWSDRRDGVPTHVGIYMGNNQMIHAANQRLNVEVRNINSWKGRIIGVRRVV